MLEVVHSHFCVDEVVYQLSEAKQSAVRMPKVIGCCFLTFFDVLACFHMFNLTCWTFATQAAFVLWWARFAQQVFVMILVFEPLSLARLP